MRGAIRKRFSANAPLLVAVNCAFRAFCFRNPPELLRSVSSSQKVLRYFLGALLFLCFSSQKVLRYFLGALLFLCFSVGSVVATCACIGGAQRRRLYIYTGTRRKPTRYSHSTIRYSMVHKSIYRFNPCFLLFKAP